MKFGNLVEICLWPHLAVKGLNRWLNKVILSWVTIAILRGSSLQKTKLTLFSRSLCLVSTHRELSTSCLQLSSSSLSSSSLWSDPWILNVQLLQQYIITIAAIDHKRANSWPFLTFSSVAWKNWPLSRGYFGSWGHALVSVAVVERWPLWTGFLIRVNVWTVGWDKIKWPLWRDGRQWSFDCKSFWGP